MRLHYPLADKGNDVCTKTNGHPRLQGSVGPRDVRHETRSNLILDCGDTSKYVDLICQKCN
jgi:hypothetical protein